MKHFRAIDGLRAWMAWWVVCQHILGFCGYAQVYAHNPAIRFLSLGGLAVMVFVIVSGFVIANLMIVKDEGYGLYIRRRFLRIYPLYAAAILFSLLVRDSYFDVIALAPWADPAIAQAVTAERQSLLAHGLAHALLIHGAIPNSLLPNALSSLLAPAWSLSLEWQFYLIAPLLMRMLFHDRLWVQSATCVVTMGAVFLAYQGSPIQQWHYPAFLPLVIGFFIIGMATRIYLENRSLKAILLPAVVALINFGLYTRNYAGGNVATACLPLLIWAITILVTQTSMPKNMLLALPYRLLTAPAIVNIGLWSYSTYLLHIPIFVVALALAHAVGLGFTSAGFLLVLLAACPVLLAASWASYHFFEQRVMRWGMSRLSRSRPHQTLANL